VEVLPQRGTRVTLINLAMCRQALFLRRALEGEAMRLIAPGVDDLRGTLSNAPNKRFLYSGP
jgi:DNA-binding GntR family transcriptional regulator